MAKVHCRRWDEFRQIAQGSKYLAYSFSPQEKIFRLTAVNGDEVIIYEESLPYSSIVRVHKEGDKWTVIRNNIPKRTTGKEVLTLIGQRFKKKFDFGLEYSISPRLIRVEKNWIVKYDYGVDAAEIKAFLERELNIPRQNIVEGTLGV